VRWVLALEYHPDGQWQVAAQPQSEGLITLLRNTPHVLTDAPEMLHSFWSAVASADCYSGRRPDASQAADAILGLIEGR
jgi:hypothetical protein